MSRTRFILAYCKVKYDLIILFLLFILQHPHHPLAIYQVMIFLDNDVVCTDH